MLKHTNPLAYVTPTGEAVLSQRFTLTEREAEMVEVRDLAVAEEGLTVQQAGLLVGVAHVGNDPAFIEWLTCGVLTYNPEDGKWIGDPDVVAWVHAVAETGKVWG